MPLSSVVANARTGGAAAGFAMEEKKAIAGKKFDVKKKKQSAPPQTLLSLNPDYISPTIYPSKPQKTTIGVDFRLKFLDLQGKRLKLTVWDTAGQERFRTLTSSYYRGAHAVVFAYDVTRRETFDALEDVWMREVQLYSTVDAAARMVVGNKVDRAGDGSGENSGEREVSRAEGEAFARRHGCLFAETSAKLGQAVSDAFEELMLKVLDTPALLETGASGRMHLTGGGWAGGGGGGGGMGGGGGGVLALGGAARARLSSSLSSCC